MKADKLVLTLINAAVSHELRNPLNALIGHSQSMLEFFKQLTAIINEISDNQVKQKLVNVYE